MIEPRKHFATPILLARVDAVNRCHAKCLELFPILLEIFKPFVGQKILKSDNELMAKFNKLCPEFPYSKDMRITLARYEYSLYWTVSACTAYPNNNGDDSCVYYESTVSIGSISDGVLTRLHDAPEHRTDYSAEEIVQLRDAAAIAEAAYNEAKGKLTPFGDYDR